MNDIIIALISAGLPTLATIFTAITSRKNIRKHAAKQSILQMILEDKFDWLSERKLPVNYTDIQNEYQIYKKAGGNGSVTDKVSSYLAWRKAVEKELKKDKRKKCNA